MNAKTQIAESLFLILILQYQKMINDLIHKLRAIKNDRSSGNTVTVRQHG